MYLMVVLLSIAVLVVLVAGGVWATRSLHTRSAPGLSPSDELDDSLIGAGGSGPSGLLF
ncbi:MAG TPA: hypothetical protein VGJ41_16825 [Nocardioides sp.]|jgi:hypothetical protein